MPEARWPRALRLCGGAEGRQVPGARRGVGHGLLDVEVQQSGDLVINLAAVVFAIGQGRDLRLVTRGLWR